MSDCLNQPERWPARQRWWTYK